MKNVLRSSLLAAGFALAATAFAATESAPGYVDFSSFVPNSEGQIVEVKVNAGLLKFAAKLAAKQEPAAAELLKRIQHVHVNVVGLDESNRSAAVEKVEAVRLHLEAAGWAPTVNVREPKQGQQVAVYIKSRGEEAIEGIVVTVIDDDKEAVFVNVVGDIRPEQLGELTARFQVDALHGVDLQGAKFAKN